MPLSLAGKIMLAPKCLNYILTHPAAICFQAYILGDGVLNAVSKKHDQNILEFQTGISAAAHATLQME